MSSIESHLQTQVPVLDLEGKEKGKITLPAVFRTPVREDVVHRVFVALDSHKRKKQGRDLLAGERTSAETYNPPTGRGISRVPRVKGERYSKSGMAGGIASVVHGRLPFPPRSDRNILKRVNKKERRLALASAIAATADRSLVTRRGHVFGSDLQLPIIVSSDLEKIEKARDLRKLLASLGATDELRRLKSTYKGKRKKNRSSIARVMKHAVGPLLVVSDDSVIRERLKSMSGIVVRKPTDLSVLDLAPGSSLGRFTIWSEKAIGEIPAYLSEICERYAP